MGHPVENLAIRKYHLFKIDKSGDHTQKPTFFVKQVEDFFPTFISKSRIPKNS